MPIALGLQPDTLTVTLASGADFIAALVASTPWPDGARIELRLSGGSIAPVVWEAAIDGTRADWDVSTAEVQPLIAAGVDEARLYYIAGDGSPLLWAKGRIRAA